MSPIHRTSRLRRSAALLLAFAAMTLSSGCEVVGGGAGSRSASGAVVLPQLASLSDTMALHADIGRTPEGAVKVFVLACIQYGSRNLNEHLRGRDAIRRLSLEYMNEPNWDNLTTAQTFVQRLDSQPWIFRSYAEGASPENNYAMDPANFALRVTKIEDGSDGGRNVWLQSGGADSPRRMYLKRGSIDNLYYLEHFGNLYVDIRKPLRPGEQVYN